MQLSIGRCTLGDSFWGLHMGIERKRHLWAAGVACFAVATAIAPANATPFPPIPDLKLYAIVSVGPKASLTINSGPITGKVLVGDGSAVSTSGGGNGSITGGAVADTFGLLDSFNMLQTPPAVTLVSSTVTADAFNEAVSLQSFLNTLGATQTLGALTGTTMITSTGALNVIDFASLQNAPLTLSGGPNDIFVLRTSGNVNTNVTMTLTGGLTANHVIWDLNGTMGNILQTSGGNVLDGTFLATMGGNFQFSALDLTGQLINTDGHIQFVSNSTLTADTFAPPVPVPEPATWALMLVSLFGVGVAMRAPHRRVSKAA